uniref:Uncharacterized protein n=1 Tax=Arundo donax TaxID=35708 RepID=A0A0A9GHD7_ARUDO
MADNRYTSSHFSYAAVSSDQMVKVTPWTYHH